MLVTFSLVRATKKYLVETESKENDVHNPKNMYIVNVEKKDQETAKRDYRMNFWGGDFPGDFNDLPFLGTSFLQKGNKKVWLHVWF